jgi:hypothetical protein
MVTATGWFFESVPLIPANHLRSRLLFWWERPSAAAWLPSILIRREVGVHWSIFFLTSSSWGIMHGANSMLYVILCLTFQGIQLRCISMPGAFGLSLNSANDGLS